MTLSQMRYAVAVEDAQNFRTAAERCSVSQSGLSMQLQKLEELLDVILFDRSKKPVLVTPEGALALLQMRTILRETERLGQIVTEESEPSGPFRLGVIPTLSPSVIPLFLADFLSEYPRVELRVEELKTADIILRLQADTLDAGIAATPLEVAGLREVRLGLEPMLAYLPPGDPLLKKKSIHQEELKKRELWVMPEGHCFRTQVLSYCGPDSPESSRRVHFESGSFETLIKLVDAGLGATVLPLLVAQSLDKKKVQTQLRPIAGSPPVREIGLVTGREALRRKVSDALVDVIRPALERSLGPSPKRAKVLEPLKETLEPSARRTQK